MLTKIKERLLPKPVNHEKINEIRYRLEKLGYPPSLNHLLLKRLVKKELPKGLWIPRDVLYSIDIQPTIWEILEFHKEILARLDRIEEKIAKKTKKGKVK